MVHQRRQAGKDSASSIVAHLGTQAMNLERLKQTFRQYRLEIFRLRSLFWFEGFNMKTALRVIIDEKSKSLGLVYSQEGETRSLWLPSKSAYALGAHLMAMGAALEFGDDLERAAHEWPLAVSGHITRGALTYCGTDNPLEALGRYCADTGASPIACTVQVGEPPIKRSES